MNKLLFECELRKVNHPTEFSEKNLINVIQRQPSTPLENTSIHVLANCDVNVTIKEMIMGHSVGLDDAYYRPNEKQLLAEYSKAINELTINEENRLKIEVDELKAKTNEVSSLKLELEKMNLEHKKDRLAEVSRFYSLVKELNKNLPSQHKISLEIPE